MASTIVLRRATAASSSLLWKLSNPVRYSASLAADLDLRCDSPPSSVVGSGSIDRFPPLLNSFGSVAGGVGVWGFGSRQIWDVKGEEKSLYLKMAVPPDQGKVDDANVPMGIGIGGKGSEEEDGGRKSSVVIITRGIISTALFPISLFLHINEGMEEIIADYVHHELTRTYILVSMRLFLLIAAKDAACVSLFF